jgi:hypothetical protein
VVEARVTGTTTILFPVVLAQLGRVTPEVLAGRKAETIVEAVAVEQGKLVVMRLQVHHSWLEVMEFHLV